MVRSILASMCIVALSGCVAIPIGTSERVAETTGLTSELRDAQGGRKATATLSQQGDAVRVAIAAEGMARGVYAAHVHTTGRCDGPDFTTAGGHWNPTGREHGRANPAGTHLGDLPNLSIGANGRGSVSFLIRNASLTSGANALADADGAAVMIHAAPDDYRTDPSGNSGARIACGVVGS